MAPTSASAAAIHGSIGTTPDVSSGAADGVEAGVCSTGSGASEANGAWSCGAGFEESDGAISAGAWGALTLVLRGGMGAAVDDSFGARLRGEGCGVAVVLAG